MNQKGRCPLFRYTVTGQKSYSPFFSGNNATALIHSTADPPEHLLAMGGISIFTIQAGIYDPTCGSDGLLLKAYKKVPSRKMAIYGQELNTQTWALCTVNMFLHGVDDARIWQGGTLSNPQNQGNDQLMRFQVEVANPPFSLGKWDSGFLADAGADS